MGVSKKIYNIKKTCVVGTLFFWLLCAKRNNKTGQRPVSCLGSYWDLAASNAFLFCSQWKGNMQQ